MTELVTAEQADAVFLTLAWVGPLLGALIGLMFGYFRRCLTVGLWQGVAVGLLGPIVNALWLLHGALMAYDPQTGVAGLHRVSAHLISAVIFIAVGLVLGMVYRRLFFHGPGDRPARDDAAPDERDPEDGPEREAQ